MLIQVVKSILEGVVITASDTRFVGFGLLLDGHLMAEAGFQEYEKVRVVNLVTNEEFDTYLLSGPKMTGTCYLCDYIANKGKVGDRLTFVSYAYMTRTEALDWTPQVTKAPFKPQKK